MSIVFRASLYVLCCYIHVVSELLSEWRQLNTEVQRLLHVEPINSNNNQLNQLNQVKQVNQVTSFNATDELKVDLLQSALNLTHDNWVTGSQLKLEQCCMTGRADCDVIQSPMTSSTPQRSVFLLT